MVALQNIDTAWFSITVRFLTDMNTPDPEKDKLDTKSAERDNYSNTTHIPAVSTKLNLVMGLKQRPKG